MCGFSGVVFAGESLRDAYPPGLVGFRRAADRVAHRGDTEHREWLQGNIWLSHFRLAFQDVTSGAQPMLSADGRHVIVFNGEVYNHLQLRPAISVRSGNTFKTRSDTETLIEGWKAFGADFFDRLEGEYALVILAVDGSELVAHRDRFGVKPLFLRGEGLDGRGFACFKPAYYFRLPSIEFSSEIKGLASDKVWQRDGLLRQFVGLYEPISTPFQNLIQIPPGAVMTARRDSDGFDCQLLTQQAPVRSSVRGTGPATRASEDDFERAFRTAVSDRLLSDVELGVYLSGGVDSRAVAYELARSAQGGAPIKSFTVGFKSAGYDETAEAVGFARHIGFQPHVVRVDSDALNYSYPLAVQNSELVQPYTNGAAKWWLSLFARQYVHGVLTGDGADEVFCGYPSYRYANWWKFVMRGRGKAERADQVLALLGKRPLGDSWRDRLYSARFSAAAKNPWLAGSSAPGSGLDFVESMQVMQVAHPLFGQIHAITTALLGAEQASDWLQGQAESVQSWFAAGLDGVEPGSCNPENTLLMWQNYFARTHLPVLVLNWVGDRMEMANTLEGRTPFMAHNVRQLLQNQPDHALVSGLRDKVLLRRTYARLFDAEYANAPKKQFNAPFLDSQRLIDDFSAASILEETGIADGVTLQGLQRQADAVKAENPYLATHLRSTHQTALSLAIVHRSIVNNQALERDPDLEAGYLQSGGAV